MTKVAILCILLYNNKLQKTQILQQITQFGTAIWQNFLMVIATKTNIELNHAHPLKGKNPPTLSYGI